MQGTQDEPGIIPRAVHGLMARLEHVDAEQVDVGVSFVVCHGASQSVDVTDGSRRFTMMKYTIFSGQTR